MSRWQKGVRFTAYTLTFSFAYWGLFHMSFGVVGKRHALSDLRDWKAKWVNEHWGAGGADGAGGAAGGKEGGAATQIGNQGGLKS
jgi:hypothetical protein